MERRALVSSFARWVLPNPPGESVESVGDLEWLVRLVASGRPEKGVISEFRV